MIWPTPVSDTINEICLQYAKSRKQTRARLAWRSPKTLGLDPEVRAIKLVEDAVIYLGRVFRLWLSRPSRARLKPAALSRILLAVRCVTLPSLLCSHAGDCWDCDQIVAPMASSPAART